MHEPHLILNWGAIAAAVVACFFFGFVWYTLVFGKIWGRAMGFKVEDCKPDPAQMRKGLAIQLLGLVLTTYVIAHTGQIWRPSVWGLGPDLGADWQWGFMCGVFTWLGFYVPLQLNKVAWEMRPWKVFFINTGHDFINLQIISQILAHWR